VWPRLGRQRYRSSSSGSSGSTGWTPEPLPPAAATAGTAAERRGRDRRAAPLEFALHVIGLVQLVSSRAKSRLVDPRCLAAGGRPAELAWARLAPRAWPCSPAVCDVERRRIRCCPIAPRQPASRTRGRATCRAPVLEAQSAVAHRALRGSERGRRRRNAAPLSRHRADLEVRRRSPGSDQRQPWKCADASLVFRPHSVHQFHLGRIPAAAAVHSDFRRFAGTSCPRVSGRERSKHPRPSMVRKGSSVRVRQRAWRATPDVQADRRLLARLSGRGPQPSRVPRRLRWMAPAGRAPARAPPRAPQDHGAPSRHSPHELHRALNDRDLHLVLGAVLVHEIGRNGMRLPTREPDGHVVPSRAWPTRSRSGRVLVSIKIRAKKPVSSACASRGRTCETYWSGRTTTMHPASRFTPRRSKM